MIFIKENSMKNIFELSQEEKNKIRGLHESYKHKPGTKLIWEQSENDELKKLNIKINEVVSTKQSEIFNNVTIEPTEGNLPTILIKTPYSSNKIDINKQVGNSYETGPFNMNIVLSATPLSNYITEIIGTDENFTKLYNKPSIKNQMDKMLIPVRLYSENGGTNITAGLVPNERKYRKDPRYHEDSKATWNSSLTPGSNIYLFPNDSDSISYVQFGNTAIQLIQIAIQDTEQPPTPDDDTYAPKKYTFILQDPFKFDSDVLTENGTKELNTQLSNLRKFLSNAFTLGKLSDILNNPITLLGYASSDADPSTKDGGNLPACSKNGKGIGPRGEYDKCLSQERANRIKEKFDETLQSIKIVRGREPELIKDIFPSAVTNWVKAKGMGQDSSKSGIDWTTPHTPIETSADRRVDMTPPTITVEGNLK